MNLALALVISLLAFSAQGTRGNEPNTDTPSHDTRTPGNPIEEESSRDVYPRWSIVGEWRVTHPDWTGILTIHENGRVTNSIAATGRWTLTSEDGTPLLVIRWDQFGTESVAMVTTDHFRGQKRKSRFIDMRRGGAPKPRPD